MLIQTKTSYYTPEEYLALEEVAEIKSEYLDGEIVPMTGGTANHNQISLNLAMQLRLALKGQSYRVFINDMRLWIPRNRRYTYPDVMLIAGSPIFTDDSNTTVTNPSVIAESLSKSTQDYDKGEKFDAYRSIPELQEYILIDQYKIHVIQYRKTPDGWLLTESQSVDAVLSLSSVNLQIALSEIYDLVEFD
ncbi:Uma2 family endonuclease [Argonema galeatum]|uniref:Uma2 family endonuclease n=1 Tax=Argonema galeatum TaxID=2942762 RepID=UPI002011DF9D|nr:Uma2 family endonuclease [Argonema galeatum]MCL1464158.1 Uma2 family endonuclease [Argonema galeatum A003/A1]